MRYIEEGLNGGTNTHSSSANPKDIRELFQKAGPEAVKQLLASAEKVELQPDKDGDKKNSKRRDATEKMEVDPAKIEELLAKIYYDGRQYHYDNGVLYVPMGLAQIGDLLTAEKLDQEQQVIVLNRINTEHYVKYVGPVAGMKRGFRGTPANPVLVDSSPNIIQPKKGSWETLRAVFEAILGSKRYGNFQVTILLLWIKLSYEALVKGIRRPAQALVFAGPRNCGKSLLIDILVQVFGGRRGNPQKYISGRTNFNGDLVGSELLAIDDESGSTDIRTRRHVGAAIKNMLFSGEVQIEAKFQRAFSLAPFWRLVIACNNEPENLLVLPPLTPDIEDKITIFRCRKRKLPMDTEDLDDRQQFFATLVSEIPAMLWELGQMEVPEDLRETRCGLEPFHHQGIIDSLDEMSPQRELLRMIDAIFVELLDHAKWTGTAADVRDRLFDSPKHKYDAQKMLFNTSVTGRYLKRLIPTGRVKKLKLRDGIQRWKILPPITLRESIKNIREERAAKQ